MIDLYTFLIILYSYYQINLLFLYEIMGLQFGKSIFSTFYNKISFTTLN